MLFLDKRSNTSLPINRDLLKLRDEIDARQVRHQHYNHCVIYVQDFDPHPLFGHREHLAMNFEPNLDEAFKEEWYQKTSKRIVSVLIEDTEWKRYAWGVYQE